MNRAMGCPLFGPLHAGDADARPTSHRGARMVRTAAARWSISRRDRPHSFGGAQGPGAHGLIEFQGLDVVVVEEIVKAIAVEAVLVVAEVLGVGRGVHLVKVASAGGRCRRKARCCRRRSGYWAPRRAG